MKSVLGEFSSGVSMPWQGPSVRFWGPFLPSPPVGVRGHSSGAAFSHVLRNPTFGVISTREWCLSKPQTSGDEIFSLAKMDDVWTYSKV